MKTIGSITNSNTNEFQKAIFLNESSLAYGILDENLNPDWYPNDTESAWTDIAVLDGKYYAAFGEDSVMVTSGAKLIYIEVEPTESMKSAYEYFKQY